MSLRTSATRYARALFDVAIKESDPVRVERSLTEFVDVMEGHPELSRALTSPTVPQAARVGVVGALTTRAGTEAPVARLLTLLATRGRLELLPMLLEVFRERVLAYQNVVRATVTTATPLSPDTVAALEQRLGTITGKHVRIAMVEDPALIGGVVATIGSTVYDGSLRTQLQKMRQQLVEGA